MVWMVPISSKGQITIPIAIRRQFGLKQRGKVILQQEEKTIRLEPISGDIFRLVGILKSDAGKKQTSLEEVRKEALKLHAAEIAQEGLG